MVRWLLLLLLAAPAVADAQSPEDEDPCAIVQDAGSAVVSSTCAPAGPSFPAARLGPGDTAFGYNSRFDDAAERTFLSFTLGDPAVTADGPNVLAPDEQPVRGCDFTNDDFATLYCMSAAGQLFTVGMADGVVTVLGTGDYEGQGVTDITYSVDDDAWYATAVVCGARTSLYSFDPADGTATFIGSDTGLRCAIAMAAAPDGRLYAYDILSDRSAVIRTADGGHEILGDTGVNLSFAQSMDCDASDGICYAFGYLGDGVNGLYTMDLGTGAFTRLGALAPGAEYVAGAIAASRVIVSSTDRPGDAVSLDVIGSNPARRAVRVGIRGESARSLSVRVYDSLGREVATLHDGPVPPGSRLDLRADVSAWAPGAYVIRAVGEGVSLTQTVTVVR